MLILPNLLFGKFPRIVMSIIIEIISTVTVINTLRNNHGTDINLVVGATTYFWDIVLKVAVEHQLPSKLLWN